MGDIQIQGLYLEIRKEYWAEHKDPEKQGGSVKSRVSTLRGGQSLEKQRDSKPGSLPSDQRKILVGEREFSQTFYNHVCHKSHKIIQKWYYKVRSKTPPSRMFEWLCIKGKYGIKQIYTNMGKNRSIAYLIMTKYGSWSTSNGKRFLLFHNPKEQNQYFLRSNLWTDHRINRIRHFAFPVDRVD